MELKGKRQRHGAAAAPTTRTPGSFPPSCRDLFRWIRLTAPYSKERLEAARQYAREHSAADRLK